VRGKDWKIGDVSLKLGKLVKGEKLEGGKVGRWEGGKVG